MRALGNKTFPATSAAAPPSGGRAALYKQAVPNTTPGRHLRS